MDFKNERAARRAAREDENRRRRARDAERAALGLHKANRSEDERFGNSRTIGTKRARIISRREENYFLEAEVAKEESNHSENAGGITGARKIVSERAELLPNRRLVRGDNLEFKKGSEMSGFKLPEKRRRRRFERESGLGRPAEGRPMSHEEFKDVPRLLFRRKLQSVDVEIGRQIRMRTT